jgi:hypothetical protein
LKVAQNVVNSITGIIKFGVPLFNGGDAKVLTPPLNLKFLNPKSPKP